MAKRSSAPTKSVGSATPARQLSTFIARFEPAYAQVIRAVRARLRKRFPHANEIVYDN